MSEGHKPGPVLSLWYKLGVKHFGLKFLAQMLCADVGSLITAPPHQETFKDFPRPR